MDLTTFRADFPEFTDLTVYTDDMVTFWSGLAETLLPSARWGSLWPYGVILWTAHNLVLQAQDVKVSTAGGTPGQVTGAVSSKSAGPVSVSYDSSAAKIEGAGDYNLTKYGIRFKKLANIVGIGGLQLSGCYFE